MTRKLALVVVLGSTLACTHRIAPQSSGAEDTAPYPTGDAVGVYQAAIAAISPHLSSAGTQIVIRDHTTGGEPDSSNALERMWRERAARTPIDPALLADVIAANRTSAPLRPDFLEGRRATLVSQNEIESLQHRGDSLDRVPRAQRSPHDIGFWALFYQAYPSAKGFIGLSKVGFNHDHTVAAIEYSIGCGGLCGNGGFMLLRKTASGWVVEKNVGEWVS